jgi:hypothetical protein
MEFLPAVVQTLHSTETVVRACVWGMDKKGLTTRPTEKEWAVVEVLCHLRDLERDVFPQRIELIRKNNGSLIEGFDEQQWALDRNYKNADPLDALDAFCDARQKNLSILDEIREEELEKIGLHSQFGPLSLRALLADWAGSDLTHSAQIQRIRTWRFYPELGPFQRYFKKALRIGE